ncbi:CPBP family intramembrane glutamic endopeptidase [Nocardioides speluncae]|uniref:CPBP family intramembrane glutamic endopeptidase n=1 Tax=Nocardioides speluncae TaxID=2670337 RepID=UPI001F0B9E41|nr:type II CAAX endopeptidase family protein [Nocardioides speluncae]
MHSPEPVAVAATPPAGHELGYHELHKAGRAGWWRPVVGVVVGLTAYMLILPGLWLAVFLAGLVASGHTVDGALDKTLSLEHLTPTGLAYINVALASAIPIVFFLTWALHGLRPGWVTSVLPRMRWRLLATCIGLALVTLIVTLLVASVMPSGAAGDEVSGELNDFTARTRDFLLVILLLTPLQAAGEEYAFRGYLTQAFGGLFGRTAAIVIPAVLFALAHGLGQAPPVFFDRLAFGLVAGLLVVLTGGLEAGIAMHVLNNWVAFGVSLAYGDISTALASDGEGSWWMIPVTLTQSLLYLGLVLWVTRSMGLRNTAEPGVLAASTRRVYGFSSAP